MASHLRSLYLAVMLIALTFAARARAQCETPPQAPTAVTPASGAQGVTTDSWVMVRYSPGYFGPTGPGDDPATLVALEACGACDSTCTLGSGVRVPGEVQVFEDDLFFIPNQPLTSRTRYVGRADGLEGSISFSFCSGFGADNAAPQISSILRNDSISVGDSCELPHGGYRIGIYTDPATDDGPSGSLEYLLFLTRGDGVTAPVLVDRVRNFAAGEITMRVFLDRDRAATQICVIAAVMDGAGRVSFQERESCFDPVAKVTFQGCGVSRVRSLPLAWLLAASMFAITWRARRRASPARS